MKILVASAFCFFCLCAPVFASGAKFSNDVLVLDSVQVGTNTYSVELIRVPDVTPLTFTVAKAVKVGATTAVAASFSGTSLSIPNVLVNGTMRASARLSLVGQNPYRFQLSTYSVLRSVELDSQGQTLTPGRIFNVKYSGGVLPGAEVVLKVGATQLQSSVLNNTIVASVPAGISGTQVLTVELDSDTFQLPLAIAATPEVVDPKPYISSYASELSNGLTRLGLPTGLLDTSAIASQLATLPEAEAKVAALQIRENLEPLLAQVNQLLGSSAPSGANMYALTITTREECEQWGKRFKEAHYLVSRGYSFVSDGIGSGLNPIGAIKAGMGIAAMAIGAEVASRYFVLIESRCLTLSDVTFTQLPLLQGDIVLTRAIEMFEGRPRSFELTEFFKLDDSVSNTYVPLAMELKANLMIAVVVAREIPLAAASSAADVLTRLADGISAGGTRSPAPRSHKFTIRGISDSSITASTVNVVPGSLTMLFDVNGLALAETASRTFTVELYNAEDGISITVPIKLNGASMLEDLKDAALGRWTVTAYSGSVVLDLEFRPGGKGAYLWPLGSQDIQTSEGGYCKISGTAPGQSGVQRGTTCEYPLTWKISRNGSAYELTEEGLWLHDGCCTISKSPLTLPLTQFIIYGNGTPLRTYVKK